MQHEKEKLKAVLKKLLTKKASFNERKKFVSWFTQLDLRDSVSSGEENEENIIRERIRSALYQHAIFGREKKVAAFPFWLRSVAASLFLFGLLTLIYKLSNRSVHQVEYSIVKTKNGERKIVTLTDGTQITLNNTSTLKYPETFNEKKREVFLDGEAFFEVRHDARKPFQVHVKKINVQVLGTSFNIKAYPDENDISITVNTGKVGVEQPGRNEPYILLPGDQLICGPLYRTALIKHVDASAYKSWEDGYVIFQDERMENVARRLERWYNVKINVDTRRLNDKRVSLRIKGESLENVLHTLSVAAGFHYRYKRDAYFINK